MEKTSIEFQYITEEEYFQRQQAPTIGSEYGQYGSWIACQDAENPAGVVVFYVARDRLRQTEKRSWFAMSQADFARWGR